VTCPHCGAPVEQHDGPGRPRDYCSDRCSQAERNQRRKEREAISGNPERDTLAMTRYS